METQRFSVFNNEVSGQCKRNFQLGHPPRGWRQLLAEPREVRGQLLTLFFILGGGGRVSSAPALVTRESTGSDWPPSSCLASAPGPFLTSFMGNLWSGRSSNQRAMRCLASPADLLSSLYTLHAARLGNHLYPSIMCEGSPYLNSRLIPVLADFTSAAVETQNARVAGRAPLDPALWTLLSFWIRKRPISSSSAPNHISRGCDCLAFFSAREC